MTSFSPDLTDFKIHIAIDFGTDGVGMAYAYNGEVFVHSRWSSKQYGDRIKRKTSILMDANGMTQAFGKDARRNYIGLPAQKDIWMLFERFKMSLYDEHIQNQNNDDDEKQPKKVSIADELKATNNKTLPSETVFVGALKHLKLESEKFRKKKKIRVKDNEIEWIITVPAIWNDHAKYKMKQWAIKAGLVDINIEGQCKIVYEPDCASLAIQHLIHNSKQQKYNSTDDADDDDKNENNLPMFNKEDKYILVDAGGGTVDIACHEILGDFGVKEIHRPSGGPWGGCYIDDQYIELLKQVFGAKWMDQLQENEPDIYMDLIDDFQIAKERFFEKPEDQKHNVYLPMDFMAFMNEKIEDENNEELDEDLEDFVLSQKVNGKSNLLKLTDEYLEIDISVWEAMFNHVIDPTIMHIKKLLDEPKVMRKCKYLCLVGGLSCSSYFQFKMQQEFGAKSRYNLEMVISQRPILSVVEGAAHFGITKNYIKARRIGKTYGCILNQELAKAVEENKEYDNNCFLPIVIKDEEISTNQVKKHSLWRSGDSMKVTIPIYCSDMCDPKISSDGKKLAELHIMFDSTDEINTEIVSEWHFYDTTLKVVVYRKKHRNDKKEQEISYELNDT